jgi:hypothetical protein
MRITIIQKRGGRVRIDRTGTWTRIRRDQSRGNDQGRLSRESRERNFCLGVEIGVEIPVSGSRMVDIVDTD